MWRSLLDQWPVQPCVRRIRMADMSLELSFAADYYAPGEVHPRHQHDCLHFSIVLRGSVAETVGGDTEYAGPLSVVAKNPGVKHADEFGSRGAALARLALEGGTLGDAMGDSRWNTEWRWTHDPEVAKPFLRLVHRGRQGVTTFECTDVDVVDLLAAFTAQPARQMRGKPPAWLEQTMVEMRESWNPGVVVTDIARGAGVHPVYLARVVRRWYGTTVGDELRRLRFRWAVAAISSGGTETVSEVAHAAGFSDEPHLCREFRKLLDVTPRHYRTITR